MSVVATRVRCPSCGDEHDVDERIRAAGRRLCPECDHHIAEPVDGEVDSPR